MATGYWIVRGDKTSCGGMVLEGSPNKIFAGHPVALQGGKVSCGKYPGAYHVRGGHPGDIVQGVPTASTLYSRSTCPCKAAFIPSQTWAIHGSYQESVPRAAASSQAQEVEQHAQAARKNAASATRDGAETQKEPEKEPQRETREITLTIGVFFDGTGNNAINTNNMLKACTAVHFSLTNPEAEGILGNARGAIMAYPAWGRLAIPGITAMCIG